MPCRVLSALTLTALLAVPGSARAAEPHLLAVEHAVQRDGKTGFDRPDAALLPDGRTVVVWNENEPFGADGAASARTHLAVRRAGGGWTDHLISPAGTSECDGDAQVLATPDGGAAVVRSIAAGCADLPRIAVRRLAADGTLGPDVVLPMPERLGSWSAILPSVAVAPDGRLLVVALLRDVLMAPVQTAVAAWTLPADGAAPVTKVLATADRTGAALDTLVGIPGVAADAAGRVTATWRRKVDPSEGAPSATEAIEGRSATPDGTWADTTETLAPAAPGQRQQPVAAAGADTTAVLVEQGTDQAVAIRRGAGPWTTVPLPTAGDGASSAALSVSPEGRILVTWVDTATVGAKPIQTARLEPGSDAPLLAEIAGTTAPDSLDAGWAGGRAMASWFDMAGHRIELATAAGPTAAWDGKHLLDEPTEPADEVFLDPWGPALATSADGDAAVAWTSTDQDGGHGEIRVQPWDGAAPKITGTTFPTQPLTRQTLPYAAEAIDRWGTPTVDWAFDDGATATGGRVDHAFTAPGEHTVDLTATDAAGNRTSERHPLTLFEPPASPPPSNGGGPTDGGTITIPDEEHGTPVPPRRLAIRGATRLDRHGRLTLAITTNRPGSGTVRITVKAGRRTITAGTAKVRAGRAGTTKVSVRATAAGRKAYKKPGARVSITLTWRDAAGGAPARITARTTVAR